MMSCCASRFLVITCLFDRVFHGDLISLWLCICSCLVTWICWSGELACGFYLRRLHGTEKPIQTHRHLTNRRRGQSQVLAHTSLLMLMLALPTKICCYQSVTYILCCNIMLLPFLSSYIPWSYCSVTFVNRFSINLFQRSLSLSVIGKTLDYYTHYIVREDSS